MATQMVFDEIAPRWRTVILELGRWMLLGLALYCVTIAYLFSGGSVDSWLRPYCPDGWWRTGGFHSFCAYPPISIFKFGMTMLVYGVSGLLAINFIAPRVKRGVSYLFLCCLLFLPWFTNGQLTLSWVLFAELSGVIFLVCAYSFLVFDWRPKSL